MDKNQLRKIFESPFITENWYKVMKDVFRVKVIHQQPVQLLLPSNDLALNAYELGHSTTTDDRVIGFYQVNLSSKPWIEMNRVGLRSLLRNVYKNDVDGALIVFVQDQKWRFSFVSEIRERDEFGEITVTETEPKRYTYLMGAGEVCRTATDRFDLLQQNPIALSDIKDAFSVEKLSKEFFDEYKKQYDVFCNFMISKPNIRQAIFNGDEKAIRDFNKKLLGRIVFLYFIQKKGWMGVPVGSKWGQGDLNFLSNLFNQYINPELFYNDILTRLFFDTLNTKRKDDIIELVKGHPCRIPYLNGGLFEEDNKKHRNIILNAQLFRNLFDFFNQYNFTIYEDDPNDQTVAVDPEMLGHIFENLLEDNKDKGAFYTPKEIVHYMCQESLIEYLTTWFENKGYEVTGYIGFDKPNQPQLFSPNEGRKGQLVLEIPMKNESKAIDRSLIEKLLKKTLNDADKKLIKQHSSEFHKALDSVKICDPAIGSGAFPMGLLQEIFNAKQTLWHFEHGNLKDFPASEVKLNIIQNSIYGVDIEKGAVDIARLRFWLSLVVDEEEPKALPNLDYKIVVGNSLVSKLGDDIIDIDWNLNDTSHGLFGDELAKRKGELLKKISQEQKEFFNPDRDKHKLVIEIRNLKIDLLINQLELMIKTTQQESEPKSINYKDKKKYVIATELYHKTLGWKESINKLKKLKEQPDKLLYFFDWKLDFPEVLNDFITTNAGFDIVIGNPPYIQLQKDGGRLAMELEKQDYQTFTRTGDIYALFYEKGMQLLKQQGILVFITSNKWMRAGYGEKLRSYFSQYNPLVLIDLGAGVFESATVDTNILVIQKAQNQNHCLAADLSRTRNFNLENLPWMTLKNLGKDTWTITSDLEQRIKAKIEAKGKPLKEWDIQINYGIKTGYNEAFIIDGKKKDELIAQDPRSAEIIKPILRGRDIKRYKAEFADLWLIYIPWHFPLHKNPEIKGASKEAELEFQKQYPVVYQHLLAHKDKLSGRNKAETGIRYEWYALQRWGADYYQEFEKEKIVFQEMVQQSSFVYDLDKNYFCLDTGRIITGKNLKFLISILNSKFFFFAVKNFYGGGGLGETGVRMKHSFFENFVLKQLSESEQQPFVELVNQILAFKEQGKDTTALERQIDILVYHLYELTFEEAKIIDPELSEEDFEKYKIEK